MICRSRTVTLSIDINETAWTPADDSWITWNPTTDSIEVTPTCNCNGGNQSITVIFSDGISVPVNYTFNLDIKQFWPLVQNMSYPVDNVGLVVMNSKFVFFNQSYLFTDPQNKSFSMYYSSQGYFALPQFIHDLNNGTLLI